MRDTQAIVSIHPKGSHLYEQQCPNLSLDCLVRSWIAASSKGEPGWWERHMGTSICSGRVIFSV